MINVREHQRETFRARMGALGFPEPAVALQDGGIMLDFSWSERALAVVLDPFDLVKHNALTAAGWRCIYFQGSQVFQPYAIAVVAKALGLDVMEVLKNDRERSGPLPTRSGVPPDALKA